MQITIDTAQPPKALLNDFTQAIRIALGPRFYIEEGDVGNFTADELADPKTNLSTVTASPALPAPTSLAALPPVVSTPAATSSAAAPAAVQTDSEGNVWDVRIHSGGKSTIANGTWKLKKGVDKALVDQINAQNRSLVATPLPSATPTLTVVPASLPPLVAPLPELPPVAQVAPPDVEIVVSDYPTFAQFVAQQMVAKPISTKRELDKGLAHYGMVDAAGNPDITALQLRGDVVMPLHGWLKAVVDLCAD